MKLARVVGTVVSTRKEAAVDGLRLMLIAPTDEAGEAAGNPIVAADAVGSGVGELVLFASGSSARQTAVTKDRPVDAVIMAIVDVVDRDGQTTYAKGVGEA
ncbi:MAG: ethanolamine utilization protein EutN [Myxococcales bacterium]|nr:ethanolamine utilization protein EutN [Myxococcales bacterium]|tara:strand:- start:131 stop:433 length:303 start_codon:yes stop_codon:yes gene_type:complete